MVRAAARVVTAVAIPYTRILSYDKSLSYMSIGEEKIYIFYDDYA